MWECPTSAFGLFIAIMIYLLIGLLIVNDFLVEFSLNTCYIDYTKKGATDRRLTH